MTHSTKNALSTSQREKRGVWSSKLGFILAASGSAIGLGNIVFFSSNAYQFGGGAFYLPYFIALFLLGIPVMILEFGLGAATGKAFPSALHRIAGKKGEFVGWWAQGSALFITMFYVAILGWALGMMIGTFGSLFEPGITAPFSPFSEPTTGPSAMVFFFNLITTAWPLLCVIIIWALNLIILSKGPKSIERAVRVFVPLMWLFMIGLIFRGLTFDGGVDGVLYLFTPNVEGVAEPQVWKGAFAQMFFSLSLGLGAMTTYASYLPKDTDQVNNALLVSFLNCGFEYVAGIAIFALLFVFALNPAGSTLTLSFFAIPQGIAAFPWGVRFFGFLFFFLLVVAGLTSSISLIESTVSSLIDKLNIARSRALTYVAIPGIIGSLCFALPQIIDPDLAGNGTLGLTLLDVMDHWAFGYSLLTAGFFTCILVGWVLGAKTLRLTINAHSKLTLRPWFDVLIKYIVPAVLGSVLVWSLYDELTSGTMYGSDIELQGFGWIPYSIPAIWLISTLSVAFFLTRKETHQIKLKRTADLYLMDPE
ncbi:MAG: sodium-dependent transporter [Rhodothermaceae bacterium]|nr:sodium-dependent transporter [Rhodothermaceae bacterium]